MDFAELSVKIDKRKINQFKKKGIENVDDLVRMFPRGYIDYRTEKKISEVKNNDRCVISGIMKSVVKRMGNSKQYVKATVQTESGDSISLIYFNPYINGTLQEMIGKKVAVGGTISLRENFKDHSMMYSIVSPDFCEIYTEESCRIYPVYSKIAGMSEEYFANVLSVALKEYDYNDSLTDDVRKKFDLVSVREMIMNFHYPKNEESLKKAQRRIIFEALYPLAEKMASASVEANQKSTIIPKKLTNCNKLIESLPYELTDDQQQVIQSFLRDTRSGKRINALVQGDVGCGKTICAFILMFMMSDSGYQSVLMAPTGILAEQHFKELELYASRFGLTAVYLDSSTKASEKKKILEMIASGDADFVIGTHSVISDDVSFKNLGLVVIDEEHKFGVEQRETLKEKAKHGVHNITMSATPIPRSLAMILYGDTMDIYSIKTKPNGRLPIKTVKTDKVKNAFSFMNNEIKAGRQCYIVCPLIGDEGENFKDSEKPLSVEEVKVLADKYFDSGIKVASLNGKMKNEEKMEIISAFEENKIQALIATTIVEVGVNVPNTTVITIVNAERFGIAGLHQLRGRVGRSNLQSYCVLVSADKGNPRIDAMCSTNDGFEIANKDLELRGTGDFIGTRQSGDEYNVRMMLKYPKFYESVKAYVKETHGE